MAGEQFAPATPKINHGAAAHPPVPEILQACAVFSVIAIAGAVCKHG